MREMLLFPGCGGAVALSLARASVRSLVVGLTSHAGVASIVLGGGSEWDLHSTSVVS